VTEPADHATILREFEELLDPARAHLYRTALREAVHTAITRAMMASACLAAAYCAIRLAYRIAATPTPMGWKPYVGMLAAAALVAVAATLIPAVRRRPELGETAERLDLACNDHNRVATALCLARQERTTPFARAAIRDGLTCLHMIKDTPPRRRLRPFDAGRTFRAIALCVAFTAVAFLMGDATGSVAADGARDRPAAAAAGVLRPAQDRSDRRSEPSGPADRSRPAAVAARPSSHGQSAGPLPAGVRNEAATGRAGGRTGAEASPSRQSASARSDPTDASAMAHATPQDPTKGSPPGRPRESHVTGGQKQEQAEESSPVGQGAAGGGTMSAVRHTWSQREQAVEGIRQDDQSDEQTENESESNTQRGGVQPSLKDRNEAPNRDLGISGEEGPPGAGRGGPTPPKKARGTASLVLGVPIPDFVKGRVGPGLTKINQERVEPSPMPGDVAKPADAAVRSSGESPGRRFEIPAAFASIVRGYLIALHSSDRNAPDGSGPTDAVPNASSQTGETPAIGKEGGLQP